MRVIAIIMIIITLPACRTPSLAGGSLEARETTRAVTIEQPDGSKHITTETLRYASARQPQSPEDGGEVTVSGANESGRTSAILAGGSRAIDVSALRQTEMLTWVGIMFLALGGLSIMARFLPLPIVKLIPWSASVASMGVGGAFLILPRMLDCLPWFLIGGSAVLIYIAYQNGVFAKVTKLKAENGKAKAEV